MKKKIGIMGGTFNPVHNGHLLLAERAYEQYQLDEVIFLPSRKPAYKEGILLASEEERKEMLQIAIATKDYFSLSTLEFERTGNTYTIDTMEILQEENPTTEYYFIIGADSLFQLEQWHRAADLMQCTHFLVASRNHASMEQLRHHIRKLEKKYRANIDLILMPTIEISSSEIRLRMRENKSISYLLPDGVEKYIASHKIYKRWECVKR